MKLNFFQRLLQKLGLLKVIVVEAEKYINRSWKFQTRGDGRIHFKLLNIYGDGSFQIEAYTYEKSRKVPVEVEIPNEMELIKSTKFTYTVRFK